MTFPVDLVRSFEEDYPYITPQVVYFNVVKRCNAGCQYCMDWQTDPSPKNDIPSSVLISTLVQLRDLGVKDVVFSGGEPLLRRDFFMIAQKAVDLGFQVRVITNGTLLNEDSIHQLIQIGISKIGVSIDSLDTHRMMVIRGLKLKNVMRAIKTLSYLKSHQYPQLNVALYVTITKLNIDDLLALVDFAQEHGIDSQFQPVHYAGTGLENHILQHLWPNEEDIERLAHILNEMIQRKRKGYSINTREEFLAQIPSFFRNKTFYPGDRCSVAYTDIVIDQDMGVRPCWAMNPVAYLTDNEVSLTELWYSDKMKDIRKVIREKKCPGCLYSCHINKSHVILPSLNE